MFLTNQAAVRLWLDAKQPGVIVNTASVAGKTGAPLLAHYCASKFAVVGFRAGLGRHPVPGARRSPARALDDPAEPCVCPGYVRTSMQTREITWESELPRRAGARGGAGGTMWRLTPMARLEEPADVADAVLCPRQRPVAEFDHRGEALNVSGGAFMD